MPNSVILATLLTSSWGFSFKAPVVYHIDMLQDLESLAARIGQLVELTQKLQSEHDALVQRAGTAEQQRDALQEQLQRQEIEYKDVAAQASRHQAEMNALRSQSEAALQQLRQQAEQTEARLKSEAASSVAHLQEQLERQKAEQAAVHRSLQASQTESSRLQQAVDAAKQRIDAVLMRLPGAPQE